MKFKNNYKNTIVQIIGGVLKRAYGEDYQSVLTMFMDTPYPTPDALVELTKEQRKQLEDRFTFCINQTAIYDTIDELISFLTQTAEKLRKTHTQIKEAGRIWLDSFLCDDKDSFLHFAIYIRYATMFRVDVENFYRKFTNTRKHGRKINDQHGQPILHSLFTYSPISSPEYVPDIFVADDYGEKYEKAANLFKDILYVLGGTYQYAMNVDEMARKAKGFPFYCKKSLLALVEEVVQNFAKCAVDNNTPAITETQIQQSQNALPKNIVDKIFSLDIPTLSTSLYHEVPTKYKNHFGILVDAKIKEQQGMSDIESKVFKHIENPAERYTNAMQARILLHHLSEFSELSKNGRKNMDKGIIACLFYNWTGAKIPVTTFLKQYYNVFCTDKKFHIAQSTFSTANSNIAYHSPLYTTFNTKVAEIINKYQGSTASSITMPYKDETKQKTTKRTYA